MRLVDEMRAERVKSEKPLYELYAAAEGVLDAIRDAEGHPVATKSPATDRLRAALKDAAKYCDQIPF